MRGITPAVKLVNGIALIVVAYSVYLHARLMIQFPDPRTSREGPLLFSQTRALALFVFLFLHLSVVLFWGNTLIQKSKDPTFRRISFFVLFLAYAFMAFDLLAWPWWPLATAIAALAIFIVDRREARAVDVHE
jgi:hypothetical protein